jgi:hypothetical protein
MDMGPNIVTILPSSSPLRVHSQQPLPILRITRTHSLLKPVRHLSLPIKPQVSLPFSKLLSERHTRVPCDCSRISIVPISSSSSLSINWTVADVGRFIGTHFPEKNIAQVYFSFFIFYSFK